MTPGAFCGLHLSELSAEISQEREHAASGESGEPSGFDPHTASVVLVDSFD